MNIHRTALLMVSIVMVAFAVTGFEKVQSVEPIVSGKKLPAETESPVDQGSLFLSGDLDGIEQPEGIRGFENLSGDKSRGAVLVQDRLDCAGCHALDSEDDYGAPPLATIARRLSPKQLVSSILEPSRDLADGFPTHRVLDDEGNLYEGVISTSSASETLILQVGDDLVTIERERIEEIATAISPMPTGQADELSPQEFSDLLAYLLSLK